jgi:hypothetical protein
VTIRTASFRDGFGDESYAYKVVREDVERDLTGAVVRITWQCEKDLYFRDSIGDRGVVYVRRSARAVTAARRRVAAELPARISRWVERGAPAEPVVAIALVYSYDNAHLPPALALATESELRRWRETSAAREYSVWAPAEHRCFEGLPAELTGDRDLDDAHQLRCAQNSNACERAIEGMEGREIGRALLSCSITSPCSSRTTDAAVRADVGSIHP